MLWHLDISVVDICIRIRWRYLYLDSPGYLMYTKLPDIFVFVYMTGVYIYLFLQRVFIFLFVSASVEGAKKILIVDEIKREKEMRGECSHNERMHWHFDDVQQGEFCCIIIICSFEIWWCGMDGNFTTCHHLLFFWNAMSSFYASVEPACHDL